MRILSLFWHNVVPDVDNQDHFKKSEPTISIFREQIRFIVNKYKPISIADFMEIIEGKCLINSYSKPPVLLGFDDGYMNIIKYALPILNEFNAPAVFFVNGKVLKDSEFVPWQIEFRHLITQTGEKVVEFKKERIDIDSKRGYQLMHILFKSSFKACKTEDERQSLLSKLADILNLERPKAADLVEDLRLATKEDLTKIETNSLLTLASHAMTHNNLANLSFEEQTYELEQSDLLLRENCPSYYPAISYPDGSFNSDTIIIAKCIYKCAFAVLEGSSYHNLYAYPRLGLQKEKSKELVYITSYRRLKYYRPLKAFLKKIDPISLITVYKLKGTS